MDQVGKVASPARGELNRENEHFSVPVRSRLRIWSLEMGSAVPFRVSLLLLHTQAESGASSQDSSRFSRRRPFSFTAIRHRISPRFIESSTCASMVFTAESPPAQGE